jgi:hypothetical protein
MNFGFNDGSDPFFKPMYGNKTAFHRYFCPVSFLGCYVGIIIGSLVIILSILQG